MNKSDRELWIPTINEIKGQAKARDAYESKQTDLSVKHLAVLQDIKDSLSSALLHAGDARNVLGGSLQNSISGILPHLADFGNGLSTAVKSTGAFIKSTIPQITSGFISVARSTKTFAIKTIPNMLAGIGNIIPKLQSRILGVINIPKKFIVGKIDDLLSVPREMLAKVKKFAFGLPKKIFSGIGGFFSGIFGGGKIQKDMKEVIKELRIIKQKISDAEQKLALNEPITRELDAIKLALVDLKKEAAEPFDFDANKTESGILETLQDLAGIMDEQLAAATDIETRREQERYNADQLAALEALAAQNDTLIGVVQGAAGGPGGDGDQGGLFGRIKEASSGWWQNFLSVWLLGGENLGKMLKNIFSRALSPFKNIAKLLNTILIKPVVWTVKTISRGIVRVADLFGDIFHANSKYMIKLRSIKSMFSGSSIGKAFAPVKSLLSGAASGFMQIFGKTAPFFAKFQKIGSAVSFFFKDVGKMFAFVSKLSGVSKILPAAGKLSGFLKGIPVIGWVITAIAGVYDMVKGWKNAAGILGKDTKDLTFFDKISAAIGSLFGGLVSIADVVLGWFGIDWKLGEKTTKAIALSLSKFFDSFTSIGKFVDNIILSLPNQIIKSMMWVVEKISGLFGFKGVAAYIKEVRKSFSLRKIIKAAFSKTREFFVSVLAFGGKIDIDWNIAKFLREKILSMIDVIKEFFGFGKENFNKEIMQAEKSLFRNKAKISGISNDIEAEREKIEKSKKSGSEYLFGEEAGQKASEKKILEMESKKAELEKEGVEIEKKIDELDAKKTIEVPYSEEDVERRIVEPGPLPTDEGADPIKKSPPPPLKEKLPSREEQKEILNEKSRKLMVEPGAVGVDNSGSMLKSISLLQKGMENVLSKIQTGKPPAPNVSKTTHNVNNTTMQNNFMRPSPLNNETTFMKTLERALSI